MPALPPTPDDFLDLPESKSPFPVTTIPWTPEPFEAVHSEPVHMPGIDLDPEYTPHREHDEQPATRLELIFRHSGWASHRQKTFDAFRRVGVSPRQVYAFCHCGAAAWIQTNAAGDKARCVCNTCHNRFCVPCARQTGRLVHKNLSEFLKGKRARFITLTLRHSNTALSSQIDRLYRSFSALRRRKYIAPLFAGGVSVMELKPSEKDGLWHVHLHVIAEGSFVDQRTLSYAWHEVTGDSSIVDVRAVDDNTRCVHYLTKYITKPVDSTIYNNPAKLDEYITSLRGRRLLTTFGLWRGFKLKEKPADNDTWTNFATLRQFIDKLSMNDPQAKRIRDLLPIFQDNRNPTPANVVHSTA